MLITFLGTGTSHGVPVLGCKCPTCSSEDPHDIRTRSSVYIQTDTTRILVDTATELRIQSLQYQVNRVDAVLITHCHADHVSGFDDLRRFNELQGDMIPVYGHQEALDGIQRMFPYIFDDRVQEGGGKPHIQIIKINAQFMVAGINIIPIPVWHGDILVYGYRIANFAYITDVSRIPDSSLELLQDLDLLVLGVLRFRPHPTHFNLESGLKMIRLLKPRRSLLTHICHEFKHNEVNRSLPNGVELAYDGEQIEL